MPAFAEEEPGTATIPTVYRDGWKITVKGKPEATGTFTMVFQPHQGEPVKFTVNVMAKQKPKTIREDIWKELSIAAGANYKVKKSGDKIVTIKKANKKVAPISCGSDRTESLRHVGPDGQELRIWTSQAGFLNADDV